MNDILFLDKRKSVNKTKEESMLSTRMYELQFAQNKDVHDSE